MTAPTAALEQALAAFAAPGQIGRLRERPLPDGMLLLLRIAAGDARARAEAAVLSGRPEPAVAEAAMLFIQQRMFAPGSDSYRILGVAADAADAEIKEHHRWLVRWLHPDRNADEWDAVYADRVNRAWQDLRTPERRADYDAQRAAMPAPAVRATPALPELAERIRPSTDYVPSQRASRHLPAIVLGGLVVFAVSALSLQYYLNRPEPASAEADVDAAIAPEELALRAPASTPAALPALPAPRAPPATHGPRAAATPPAATGGTRAHRTSPSGRVADAAPVRPAPPMARAAPVATAPRNPPAVPAPATPPVARAAARATALASAPIASPPLAQAVAARPARERPARLASTGAALAPAPASAASGVAASASASAPVPEAPAGVASPAPRAPGGPLDERVARKLLLDFRSAYASGNVEQIEALLSESPRYRADRRRTLAKFRRLFGASVSRRMDVHDVSWRNQGDAATLFGRYDAWVRRQAGAVETPSQGSIRLDLLVEAGGLRVSRLEQQVVGE